MTAKTKVLISNEKIATTSVKDHNVVLSVDVFRGCEEMSIDLAPSMARMLARRLNELADHLDGGAL